MTTTLLTVQELIALIEPLIPTSCNHRGVDGITRLPIQYIDIDGPGITVIGARSIEISEAGISHHRDGMNAGDFFPWSQVRRITVRPQGVAYSSNGNAGHHYAPILTAADLGLGEAA